MMTAVVVRGQLGGVCMNSNWSDVTRLLPRLTCPSSIELGDSRRRHTSAPLRNADRARGRT